MIFDVNDAAYDDICEAEARVVAVATATDNKSDSGIGGGVYLKINVPVH